MLLFFLWRCETIELSWQPYEDVVCLIHLRVHFIAFYLA